MMKRIQQALNWPEDGSVLDLYFSFLLHISAAYFHPKNILLIFDDYRSSRWSGPYLCGSSWAKPTRIQGLFHYEISFSNIKIKKFLKYIPMYVEIV